MDSFAKMSKMGLPPLFHAQGVNLTVNGSTSFPAGMMDSFLATAGQASPLMQLFLFVYRLIGVKFGLDPSLLLTLLGLLWGMSKLFHQLYALLQSFSSRYLMCALYVSENDHIYNQLMNFLAQQQDITSDRFLMAQTVWKSAWEEEEELANTLTLTEVNEGDDDDGPKYLNFANQAARSGPRYVPAMGTTGFWHHGTYFRVNRKKESFMNTTGWSAMKDLEEIKISCFGRNIDPIKKLLSDAKTVYYHDTRQKTTIYRPRSKESRREGSMWQQVARRPIRPMRTVVLDPSEKHNVLSDVNEYLHPRTPSWYASRGIPLRRGYLFHGPPGTGKTSFSFALAGVFGIDIYVISLQDNSVSEEDLAALFTRLPRRCIVLLEDIDTAGLRRDPDDSSDGESDDEKEKSKGENKDDKTNDNKTNKKKKKSNKNKKKKKEEKEEEEEESSESESDSESSEEETKKKKHKKARRGRNRDAASGKMNGVLTIEPISLSGLLNAIDGVASHEGRILIMTTNKPESLDEALIRPGRVDVQVGFKNASSFQAGELFHRMYEPSTKLVANGSAKPANGSAKQENGSAKKTLVNELDVTPKELRDISNGFGKLIPDDTFSPAQIQGFLLKRKKTPRKALMDAPEWIEAAIRQKELKSKVVTVQ